jgi:hypothetical protein
MRIAIGTVLTLPIRSSIYDQLSILILASGVWRLGFVVRTEGGDGEGD